jgi:hypothetical protein
MAPSRSKNLLDPTPQKFKLFKPFKLFNPFPRAPVDDRLHQSAPAVAPVKMVLHPAPQKFNIFTTFNTFATFHNGHSAGSSPAAA